MVRTQLGERFRQLEGHMIFSDGRKVQRPLAVRDDATGDDDEGEKQGRERDSTRPFPAGNRPFPADLLIPF